MASVLYALGSNGSGQLALGHCEDVNKPTACLFQENPPPERQPLAIAAGGNHTIILCNDGSVYTCGDNADGRCGFPRTPQVAEKSIAQDAKQTPHCVTSFRRVKIPSFSREPEEKKSPLTKFAHISATWNASFIATPTTIYAAGTGLKGELGLGPDISCTTHPTKIPAFPPHGTQIVHLTSGVHHTVAVLSSGEVYGWGAARHGELGEPRALFVTEPRKIIDVGFRACEAVAGMGWTYIFTAPSNHVSGGEGQFQHLLLGSDKHNLRTELPPAHELKRYSSITSSWSSIYVLLRSGTLTSWGRCSNTKDPSATPHSLPKTKVLVAGSEHVLTSSMDSGEVMAWGWGEHGNCGEGWGDKSGVVGTRDVSNTRIHPEVSRKNEEPSQTTASWNILRLPDHILRTFTNPKLIPLGAGCATTWLLCIDDSDATGRC